MKKFTVTILIVLYVTTSVGASIRMHFCMGELISLTLNSTQKDTKCSKCDMKPKEGCCEEKYQLLKVDKDHEIVKGSFVFARPSSQISQGIHHPWQPFLLFNSTIDFPKENAPPDIGSIALFVRHKNFRI